MNLEWRDIYKNVLYNSVNDFYKKSNFWKRDLY